MHYTASKSLRAGAFTLAETIISATILSTAMVAVVGLLSSGLSIAQKNSGATVAPVLAKRVVAEILLEKTGYVKTGLATTEPRVVKLYDAALRPVTQAGNSDNEKTYQEGSTTFEASFLVTWKMEDLTDELGPGMQALTVSVESPASGPAKNRRTFTYATLLHL